MKKYIKPTIEQIICASRESYLLETSMIDTGGSGRFDTREQDLVNSEWDSDWEG